MAGVATKRDVFRGKHFGDPKIEKSEKFSRNLELYQLKTTSKYFIFGKYRRAVSACMYF